MSSKILLGEIASFSNGKTSPDRDDNASYEVFGSNGVIGRSKDTNAKAGTVIIGRVGSYCGSVYYSKDKCWVTDNAIKCEAKGDNDSSYIYYQTINLNLNNYRVGSGQPLLNQGILKSLEINDVKPNTQKKIAHILSTLDDKIELNRKMNQTLEEMAQALFKSWFVDFDPVHAKAKCSSDKELESAAKELGISKEILELFPSEFEESELGMIPKGWDIFPIGDITTVSIGKTPPRKEQHWFSTNNEDVKWVSIKDMGISGVYINTTSEYLVQESIDKFNVKVIPKNTVILSFKMTLGRVAITTENMCTNEAIAHFTLTDKYKITPEYLYTHLKNFDYKLLGSTSSIATAVNSKIVRTIPTIVPSDNVMNLFDNTVKGIFDKIQNTSNEIQTLQKTRDTLLPKLLSGEIDVSELELELS